MRQTIFGLVALAAVTFGIHADTYAQDNNRENRRAEMQARQRERLVKELKLTDEQKPKFEETYTRYQSELASLRNQSEVDATTGATLQKDSDSDKKDKKDKQELTDAEATARLQAYFDQQTAQLQRQQMRLDIQKKYCAEFSAFLSPQQIVKMFREGQRARGGNNRQAGGRNRGGRDGFGDGQRGGGPRGGFGGGNQGGFGGPGSGF